jgi:serine protease Do
MKPHAIPFSTPFTVDTMRRWIVYLLLTMLASAAGAQAADEDIRLAKSLSNAYAAVAERAGPGVVHVRTVRRITRKGPSMRFPGGREEFFRRFFDDERGEELFKRYFDKEGETREYNIPSQGSGFIIDSDGHILTNNHVVQEADEIEIHLADNRTFDAEVVGTDPKSDIAVLKLQDVEGDLPVLKLGNSGKMRVGEIVVAIGSPFGLEKTVTTGIVSAKGRAVGMAAYEDYIQTDAAINPGNSGGPLMNLNGEVIGVNTAISSTSGSNSGVGFAIPSNMAKRIVEQLLEHGKVTRGWIGVGIEDMDEELADHFEGYTGTGGVIITQVGKGMPAEKAGLKAGDVILEFAGKEIQDTNHLRHVVANTPPGEEVKVKVLRRGEKKTLTIVPMRQPKEPSLSSKPEDTTDEDSDAEAFAEEFGFEVQALTEELADKFGYDLGRGVLVSDVETATPAARKGLRAGMLIVEVEHMEVSDLDSFVQAMKKAEGKDRILLRVFARDTARYISLERPEKED